MQTYNLMKSGLNAAQLRSKTIANNIANINTPNYKRKYVKFEETLNNVNKTGKIEVKTDTSGAVRTDGNNLNLSALNPLALILIPLNTLILLTFLLLHF